MTDTPSASVGAGATTRTRSRRGRRVLGLILAVLIILLGLASYLLFRLISVPGDAASEEQTGGLTWVRSIYGMSDAPADQLERAQCAVPDDDGSIWITDGSHRALMHFAADGRYLGQITGPAESPFEAPSRFAIDTDGTFYACETQADTIAVVDRDGNDAGSFGIPKPVSIAVTDDRIIVGAISGFAILDKEGKPIKIVGSRGKGDAEFDYVHGVAVGDDGTIYVVDSFNNRLSAYDKDGKRLWIVRTGKPANSADIVNDSLVATATSDIALKGDDALQLPLNITIDSAGRLVVVDMYDCSLAVFDPKDGSLIAKYGAAGPDDGEFFYPTSVSYDPGRDWFTVADTMNNRVQIVRIPDSSRAVMPAVARAFTGPLRACLLPLLLLILALIVALVMRNRRRRREAAGELEPAAVEPGVGAGSDVIAAHGDEVFTIEDE